MGAYTCNPSAWEAEAGEIMESKVSLGYLLSSRTTWTTQQDPMSRNKGGGGSENILYHL